MNHLGQAPSEMIRCLLDRTSPRVWAGVDLAVVSPTCSHRAAALLLGRVPRQDVLAEVGHIQVVVALFPLLRQGEFLDDLDWLI